MNLGVNRWDEVRPPDGNLLVLVNSEPADVDSVEAFFSHIAGVFSNAVRFVIADPAWHPVLSRLGLQEDHVLLAVDSSGQRLELTHFLQTSVAMSWSRALNFRLVVGTSAHSLYNEEVKEFLEERILLISDQAWFIAHALPAPYLYVFDWDDLLERVARPAKTARYDAAARALLQKLHELWADRGRPVTEPASPDAAAIMLAGLPPFIAGFDETDASPPPRRELPVSVHNLVKRFREMVVEHACASRELQQQGELQRVAFTRELAAQREYLQQVQSERQESVLVRDRMLQEAHTAQTAQGVSLRAREKVIDDLRARARPRLRRLLRWVLKRIRR